MLSSLKGVLKKAYHPVAVIRYSNRHYQNFALDHYDREDIRKSKLLTEGELTVSSILILSSLYPADPSLQKTLLDVGKLIMGAGLLSAAYTGCSLYKCGQAELSRRDRLEKLTHS